MPFCAPSPAAHPEKWAVPHLWLQIGGWDNQSGGAAGLFFGAHTPLGRFKLTPSRGGNVCKVLASGGDNPPHSWEQNNFDDRHWQEPDKNSVWGGWHQHLSGELRSHANLSGADGVWVGHHKYNFFRIKIEAGALEPEPAPRPCSRPNRLVLVGANSPDRALFTEARMLQQGQTAALTLGGVHEGLAICKQYEGERVYNEWRYIESGVARAPHAASVFFRNGFLEIPGQDLVRTRGSNRGRRRGDAPWRCAMAMRQCYLLAAVAGCGKLPLYSATPTLGRSSTSPSGSSSRAPPSISLAAGRSAAAAARRTRTRAAPAAAAIGASTRTDPSARRSGMISFSASARRVPHP